MMKKDLVNQIKLAVCDFYSVKGSFVQFQKTRKEFNGDITLVVFSLLKYSKKNPEETAKEIGDYLKKRFVEIYTYNVIKGFLNLEITTEYWYHQFIIAYNERNFGFIKPNKDAATYLVEYSSPNTNKPIHLGHLRNNFLGYSVAEIIKASGKNVKKVQIINDRGIHICKSMLAWKEYGENETPDSSGIKGDHLVGKYYVEFDKRYKKEVEELIKSGVSKDKAEREAPILVRAKEMLVKWENQDKEVRELWNMMNGWVYEGFEVTYQRLGIDFDKNYYESNTYILGKNAVEKGVDKGFFYKKEDGSVWVDLSEDGLDEKLLLRSDGTAVYMTQDIGTAIQRNKDFDFSHMTYTVANEQDYHFKVLFLILDKLGYKWAKNCYHLSYGMVDLPSGKMKSREGTVVDADDFIQEMVDTAKEIAKELGKLDLTNKDEANNLYEIVGLGALKYFLLKVDPKKRMLFNPKESIDFNGNTAPFIQYTYARIQSLKRKSKIVDLNLSEIMPVINDNEHNIIKQIIDFPLIIQESASEYNPSLITQYTYSLVKEFNTYYQSTPIINADSEELIHFRLALSLKVGEIIKNSMNLLGVSVPERM
tara:strand:- start:283 stop:2058 length:1776 start_codon:yes stop_codon:yes gene_type:complete